MKQFVVCVASGFFSAKRGNKTGGGAATELKVNEIWLGKCLII